MHLIKLKVEWVLEEAVLSTPASTPSEHVSTTSSESLDWSIRRASYKVHNATALYEMFICISEDDQDECQELEYTKHLWDWAKGKYERKLQATGRSLLQQYTNFSMEEGQTIDEAWQSLSSIARKAVSISPQFKEIKTEERRIQQLLAALPESFSTIRDGIDLRQDLGPQDILSILREKQEQMTSQETAMFAKKKAQAGSSRDTSCFLCEGKHWVKECPNLEKAKAAVEPKQSYRVAKKQSPSRARRGSSPDKEQLKEMVKKLSLKIQSLEKRSRKLSSKKAYAAQDAEASSNSSPPSEEEDVDEVAHSTVEAKGKYKPSEWLLDSCASAHMTDQESLFRDLKPLERKKWIKVGGGYLTATHVGNAVMGGRKGKQIVLKGVLFVPGLGVNLVSWNQFSKQFGVQPPKFTLHSPDGKPVVQTRLSGGVPFIEEISQDLDELAYMCIPQDSMNDNAYALAAQTDQDQWELDRKSTRLNSSHSGESRMPSSA